LKGAPFPSISSRVTCKFIQGQQLPEYKVSGGMSTDDGPQPPATVPMSFEFPVAIPGAPPPPGPNIITIGPRPLKVPICKECDKQRKMIGKLVASIEHDNHKAQDIQEQQDDMIESYRSGPHCVHVMLRHTLQRTATHCNALQRTATRSYQPRYKCQQRHCNTLKYTATHCCTVQHTVCSLPLPLLPSRSRALSLSPPLFPDLSLCRSLPLSPSAQLQPHNFSSFPSLPFFPSSHLRPYIYICI